MDNSSTLRHIIAGNLGSIATSTWDGSTDEIIYHHKDHLGGTHVETDDTGAVVEYIIYSPFGGTIVDQKTGMYENKFKYTGKEKDEDTGWYYYGARYYNPEYGQFLSEDPLFLSIGIDKKITGLAIKNPQSLNSHAYVENNPLIKIDNTGESSIRAWLLNPVFTGIQTAALGFGSLGASIFRPASSILFNHSLTLSPSNLSINESNQRAYGNLVNTIKGTSEYQKMVNGLIQNAESRGLAYIGYSDSDIEIQSGIRFYNYSDAGTALGKTSITSFEASRNDDGSWSTSINLHDTYDFELTKKYGDTVSDVGFATLNNVAVFSQNSETITPYGVDVSIQDTIKKQ